MAYSITEFFKKIGAPLKSPRWSWGGRRQTGALVFRCWSDVPTEFSWKKREALIGYTREFWDSVGTGDIKSKGFPERQRMTVEFLAGAPGFIVFGEHLVIADGTWRTKSLSTDLLFPIIGHRVGEFGEVWAKFGDPISSREFMA